MSARARLREFYESLPFKQRVFELGRAHVRLPESIYRHLHFKGSVTIPVGPSQGFRTFHHGFQVENDLFWAGYGNGWEGTSLRLWAKLARQASTIVDIGANTGVYALAAKAVNPSAQVYAFEPIERIAEKLKGNVALNGFDISVVVAGASSETGEAVIFEPTTEHAYSASLNPAMLAGRQDLRQSRIAVTRMDDFAAVRGLTSVELVKIDAEKHEVEVLTGFGAMISKSRPTFLLEVLDQALGRKIVPFFSGLGYVFYEIVEGRELRRTEHLGTAMGNYLVCTTEAAQLAGFGDLVFHRELHT